MPPRPSLPGRQAVATSIARARRYSTGFLLKPGLYDIDADHGQIRVFDGKAHTFAVRRQ